MMAGELRRPAPKQQSIRHQFANQIRIALQVRSRYSDRLA
jgi:hypothetical protein